MTGDGKYQGQVLGEYHLIASEPILYQQSSSEKQDKKYVARYIYRVEGSGWDVGPTIGRKGGWLFNPSLSTTLPRSGWEYANDKGGFSADDSITVNEGRLISKFTEINITLTGAALEKQPKCAGVFKLQHRRIFNGRHIYKNEENELLHCGNGGGWSIGPKLGLFGIRSKSAPKIPSSSDEWTYTTGSERKEAKVKVS